MIKVSIGLEIFCLLTLSLIFISFLTQSRKNKKDSFIMYFMIPDAMIYIASNLVDLLFTGNPDFNTFSSLMNIFSYLTGYLLIHFFLVYFLELADNKKLTKFLQPFSSILILICLVPIVISHFTGFIFIFKEGHIIHGPFYLWGFAYVVITYSEMLFIAFTQKRMTVSERVILIMTIVIHVLAGLSQYFFPDLKVTFSSSCLVVVMLYMMIYSRRGRDLTDVKEELTQTQIRLMLSKIRPHFLFNSLTAISELCKENPELAKQSIDDFAKYLRTNMDSLGNDKIVDFPVELQHTKTYLNLEKLRYEEKLNIEFDITSKDFQIPSLTLQPIVENAIKHGISKKDEGGTVLIKTDENQNYYIITVQDDGPGFNQKEFDLKLRDSERSHIGLNNVKERLAKMCDGKLTISGEIGKGTTVNIFIPKK